MNDSETTASQEDSSSRVGWFDLKNFAAALSALTIFAYLVGWQYARGYFRTLGAGWALDLMGPQDLLRFASPLLGLMAFAVLGSVLFIFLGIQQLTLRRINSALISAGALTQFAGLVPVKLLSLVWQHSLYAAGLSLFVVSVSIWVVEWVWDFRLQGKLLTPQRALSAHWLIYCACAGLPWLSGSATASRDTDAANSDLAQI